MHHRLFDSRPDMKTLISHSQLLVSAQKQFRAASQCAKTAQGRRRLLNTARRRLLVATAKLDRLGVIYGGRIEVTSTTWKCRPSAVTASWVPPGRAPRAVYLEDGPPISANVDSRSNNAWSASAIDGVSDVFGTTAPISWAYPPAIDGWNLADLLGSIAGPLPHVWGRANHLSLFVAVDPYGAASILLARAFAKSSSIIVLTQASQIEGFMLTSLRLADSVIAHRTHEPVLGPEPLRSVIFFDSEDGLRAGLSQVGDHLLPPIADPLIKLKPWHGANADRSGEFQDADLVLSVSGDFALPEVNVTPRSFRSLLNANVSNYEVVMARLSIVQRNHSHIERQDHESLLRAMLAEGARIAVV